MQNFTPIISFSGGMLIGLSAVILLLVNGRIAGISSIMTGLTPPISKNNAWRLAFLAGLIVGAFLFQSTSSLPVPGRQNYPFWLIICGGFLVGFGSQLSRGCTSGHGICGIANLSVRSICATLVFMSSGFVTVFLIKNL